MCGLGQGVCVLICGPPKAEACPHRRRIWLPALQSNRDARRLGFITIESGRRIQVVDDNIQIPIAIEVGRGHSMTDALKVKTPRGPDILK